MIPVLRMFEVVVATAFYSGICYMIFEGTGRAPALLSASTAILHTQGKLTGKKTVRYLTPSLMLCSAAVHQNGNWHLHVPTPNARADDHLHDSQQALQVLPRGPLQLHVHSQ